MAKRTATRKKPGQGAPTRSSASKRKPAARRRKSTNESIRGLVELGLTMTEARAYLSMLEGPPQTAAEVAAQAGIARPKVYEALRLLEERGFTRSVIDASVTRFRALPPRYALPEWVRQRDEERSATADHELELARSLVERLPEPVEPEAQTEFFSFVEGVYGRGKTSEALRSIVGAAKSEILNMTQPPWSQPRKRWNVAELEAIERGVRVQLLITPVSIGDEDRWRPLAEGGGEVRIADVNPMKLIVCDRQVAMISLRDPTTGEQGVTNVIMRHPDVVRSFVLLFEEEWRKAKPVRADEPVSD